MRLKLALIVLGAALLLFSGLRPGALPYAQGETRYSDSVTAHWPNALFLRQSLLRGEFPLWRETTMAGQPFAANPLNKTAYPPQWLALLLPPALHLDVLIALHLLIAGAGMWRWLRALALRDEAAAFGALAYALAPRLLGHLAAGHLDVLYALAWWPWLMLGIVVLLRRAEFHPHTLFPQGERASKQDNGHTQGIIFSLQFGMVAALCALADVRVALFAFISAGVYAFYLMWTRRALLVSQQLENARRTRHCGVPTGVHHISPVGLFGLARALPVTMVLTIALFVPLVLWQPYLSRATLSAAEAGVFPLELTHFLGLILPAHRGGPETLTYLGLMTLTLAWVGLAALPRRQRILLAAALLLAALYAMGANAFLWPALTQLVPGLLWFRVPSRAWLIVALLVPALAGYGVHVLLERIYRRDSQESGGEDRSRSRLRLMVAAWMGLTAVVGAFALLVLPLPDSIGASALVFGLAVGGALLAIFSGRLRANAARLLLLGVLAADLGWTGINLLDWRGEDEWLNPHRPLAERLVELDADRVFSPTYSVEQQVAEAYGLRLFGGVDPFQLSGIVRAVEAGSGVVSAGYDPVLPSLTGISSEQEVERANRNARIDTAVLAQWLVSHVVAAYVIDHPRLELVDVVSGISIHRNLDYQPRDPAATLPDWPPDWPGLPDAAAVARLNQITSISYLVSGIGWVMCLGLLFLFRKRA
ncbi:MAG: hypothetical protein JNJ61_27850 [Anaerolineae bacterium]|nr:hypothetical protein [Anaerolineae bacterium]